MAKIRCDQCQTISATNKGYCPDCGAIFVPPYAIVEDNGTVRYAPVREDIGQGKERKLLLKKKDDATNGETATAEAPAATDYRVEERTLADLASAPAVVTLPAGEEAFPGFSLLLTLISVLGWLTLLGGPVGAAMAWRSTNMTWAVLGAIGGFFVGLLWLLLAGGGRVLLALEAHTRAVRVAQTKTAAD